MKQSERRRPNRALTSSAQKKAHCSESAFNVGDVSSHRALLCSQVSYSQGAILKSNMINISHVKATHSGAESEENATTCATEISDHKKSHY